MRKAATDPRTIEIVLEKGEQKSERVRARAHERE